MQDNVVAANQQASLAQLVECIRAAHHAAQQAGCNALHHALDAGEALIAAREQVPTGWKRWLADNCAMPLRTAMLYVQLAKHRKKIEAYLDGLSLRGALRLIAKPKNKTTTKTPKMVSLLELWEKATDQQKTEFCDAVGVGQFRAIWSLAFFRTLSNSVRVDKVAAEPNNKITDAIRKALSHMVSADEPTSSDPMRKANTNEVCSALRDANSMLRNLKRDYHAISVGIIERAISSNKKRHAA